MKLNLIQQGLVVIVVSIASLFSMENAFAQSFPQDKNTVGINSIIATEQAYKMPALNDNLSATSDYWFGNDVYNVFHNAAAFSTVSGNQSTGGPFGIGAMNSPAPNGLTQQKLAVVIPVAFLFTDNAGMLNDSKVFLYGGFMRSALPTVSLVPTDQALPPGSSITAAPVDNYVTVGAVFSNVFDNENNKKLNIATGLAYINSAPLNGSWTGVVADHGHAVALNLSAVYNMRNEDGAGFVAGAGVENLSPFKMQYTPTITYNLPGRIYAGGGYNVILPSNDQFSVAGDLGVGLLTFAGRMTGSVNARYTASLSDISNAHVNLGYSDGLFFKGPTVGTGIKLGVFNLNTGYCFGNSAFGFNKFQIGVSFFH